MVSEALQRKTEAEASAQFDLRTPANPLFDLAARNG
jgi:hypothetical protein